MCFVGHLTVYPGHLSLRKPFHGLINKWPRAQTLLLYLVPAIEGVHAGIEGVAENVRVQHGVRVVHQARPCVAVEAQVAEPTLADRRPPDRRGTAVGLAQGAQVASHTSACLQVPA